MKIKAIVSLCRQRGNVVLMRCENKMQWLGDGYALYPLYDAPIYDQTSLCTAYDINEKQRESISFSEIDESINGLCFKDEDPTETDAYENPVKIKFKGKHYSAFHTPGGVLFLNEKYLAPFKDTDGAEVHIRYSESGQAYFVLKLGFMIYGVITPANIADEKFCENLKKLSQQCEYLFQRKEGQK